MADVEGERIQHRLRTAAAGEQQQVKPVIHNRIRDRLDLCALVVDLGAVGNDVLFVKIDEFHREPHFLICHIVITI